MKKLILLALAVIMIAWCSYACAFQEEHKTGDVVTMHGCEYIVNHVITSYGCRNDIYVHKGNCRFCKERREKEMEEFVKRIKEE